MYLPATLYAMSLDPDYSAVRPLSEAIDGQVTMMLCHKINGNDMDKLRACAKSIAARMIDENNRAFFDKCSRAKMPDSTLRIRVREMQNAENKSRKAMKRDGILPEGL